MMQLLFLAHEIDGETLLLLSDDLEEFRQIIPKAVSRLKIKKLIREAKTQDHIVSVWFSGSLSITIVTFAG